jgi:predicted esterase
MREVFIDRTLYGRDPCVPQAGRASLQREPAANPPIAGDDEPASRIRAARDIPVMSRARVLLVALTLTFTFVAATLGTVGVHRTRRFTGAAAGPSVAAAGRLDPAPPSAPPSPSPPVGVEVVPIEGDLPAFVIRASAARRLSMLFVPGMCVHPGGYVQAFQYAAAARGDLVTLQGDVSCGGDGFARRWSGDLDAMNRRIEAAFRASGLGEPREVLVIGYSQGAERAERLVARWPTRYSSAILLASPIVPSAQDLGRAHAVVLMAGTLDAQANMRSAVGPLRRAGIPATFLELPGARHGQMGNAPEKTMEEALTYISDHLNENEGPGRPSHEGPAVR